MAGLATLGDYLAESRRLLQDTVVPYRYPDLDLIEALNIGLMEARRVRADLFLPNFDVPVFAPGQEASSVNFDPMYRSSLVYYVVGRAQLRDDEQTQDARAASLLTKFTAQMLSITS